MGAPGGAVGGELLSMIEASRGGRTGRARASLFTAGTARVRAAGLVALAVALPLASHAAGDGGLVLVPDGRLLVGLILLFLLLIFPVNQLLFKPIFRVLDEREQSIEGTRSRAEQLERDAAEALASYEKQVHKVRDESEQQRRSLLETARSEGLRATGEARAGVERELESARGEIEASLEAARATLRGQSQELAREAASRVLGRAL